MANDNLFSFQKPEDNAGYLLWQLTMLWQRNMNAGLDKVDLTHTQFVLLAALQWLTQNKEIVTQKEIADHAKVDKMMTSKVIRTLQQKALIERQEHQTDTRAKTVALTAKGKSVLKEAIQIVETIDRQFFSPLEDGAQTFNDLALRILNKQ